MKITADFSKITGKIKPMHGVGQPPFLGTNSTMMHYLGEAGIPYSRLHDVGGPYGGWRFVDIPNIFRDWEADETLPESYDFVFTDWLITELMKQNCEPFFRLGVTIENPYRMRAYRIFPPKDYAKWARICEHIIRHYNEGWANGFHYNIKYWEIWNEPEGEMGQNAGAMWIGTQQQYFELYEVTANHLKACFGDSIRVGGFAAIGFYSEEKDPDCIGIAQPECNRDYWLQYVHDFLKYISSEEHKAPLDFFSWHSYSSVHEIIQQERYCRRVLAKYGFDDVEDILNEWNTTHDIILRSTPLAAARVFAVLLAMQKERVGQMEFYDARLGPSEYGGIFNPNTWKPYLAYFALMSFNQAFKLQNEVFTESDDENVFVCGATNGKKSVLLLSNLNEKATEAEFDLTGVSTDDVEIRMIDDTYSYTPTGKQIRDGKLMLPANSCVEIQF